MKRLSGSLAAVIGAARLVGPLAVGGPAEGAPAVAGSMRAPRRRITRYQSPTLTGGPETWGGVPLEVDRNRLGVTPVPRTAFGDFTGNGWSDLIARENAPAGGPDQRTVCIPIPISSSISSV